MTYTALMSKENILNNWYELFKLLPVNWKDKESIRTFKVASDTYAKFWTRLSYDEQGWISEQILNNYRR